MILEKCKRSLYLYTIYYIIITFFNNIIYKYKYIINRHNAFFLMLNKLNKLLAFLKNSINTHIWFLNGFLKLINTVFILHSFIKYKIQYLYN